MLDNDLSERQDAENEEIHGPDSIPDSSLTDDIGALFDDGRTYFEAEVGFQKSRLAFVANRGKSGLVFLLAAVGFLHLALIGLVVGGIISLIPLLGPVAATAIVVGLLLVGMAIFVVLAKGKFSSLAAAFQDDRE